MTSVSSAATTPQENPPRISAVVITCNEADHIAACLQSLVFCDELLVVDSRSTDGTHGIAHAAGARVISRDWPGYRSQKEFAVAAAAHDWVLCLDADEQVTPELRREIESLRRGGFAGLAGASMRWRMSYLGGRLRFGTQPGRWIVRLFDRRLGRWRGYQVHEHVKVTGRVVRLRGKLEHRPYRDYEHQLEKYRHYAALMATEQAAAGKSGSVLKIIFSPWWCFVRGYIMKLGLLDGWRGLVFACTEASYVRQKHIKLLLMSNAGAVLEQDHNDASSGTDSSVHDPGDT
jgi:glycosyltransferase involved in cell wall biosynthesis